jgi:hypothetical protein
MNYFRIARMFTLAFALLTVANCRAESGPSLKQASALLQRISGAQVRPYSTRDFGRTHYNGAIYALVNEAKAAAMLVSLRKELPAGLVAFIGTTQTLTNPPAPGVELVVGQGNGPIDILQIAQTDAVNYGMTNEDLKRRLARWHKAYGIDVWQAETDTIQLRFIRMPPNLQSFAKEVYEFCPDIVDQGVGTQKALAQEIQKRRGLQLWWD